MKPSPLLAAVIVLATPAGAQTLAEVVYELPGDDGGLFTYLPIEQGAEYGDSAHLAGSARFLTEASVAVYSSIPRTGLVTFSIHEAVPADFSFPPDFEVGQPGVTPGALADFKPSVDPIYTSGPRSVSFEGAGSIGNNLTELVFSDINTLVGDDLFWTIEFESLSNYTDGGAFGPKQENAANLGPSGAETDGSRLYQRVDDRFVGDWFPIWLPTEAPPTSTLSVKLTAIPESGVIVLSLIGVLGLLRRRRAA